MERHEEIQSGQILPDVQQLQNDFTIDEPVIITATLNQGYYKDLDSVPTTADEMVESAVRCYEEGASIIHTHGIHERPHPGYDIQVDVDGTVEVIERIAEKCEGAIIQLGLSSPVVTPARIEVMKETDALDMLSVNVTATSRYDPEGEKIHGEFIAMEDKIELLEACDRYDVEPEIEIKVQGGGWIIQYLEEGGWVEPPYWINLVMGDAGEIWSPPTQLQLDARREVLPDDARWFTTVFVDKRGTVSPADKKRFQAHTMTVGGHVRTGVEENAPYVDLPSDEASAYLVEEMADIAKLVDRGVATPKQAREMIGLD